MEASPKFNMEFGDIDAALSFRPTDLAAVPALAVRLRAGFDSGGTKDVEYRLVQLRRLYWALVDFEPLFIEALRRDLRKAPHESIVSELDFARDECAFAIRNLRGWVRDEPIEGFPLPLRPMGHRVRKEPIGPVLIIGAYNFPVLVCLHPLIGAIAAGCTAVIKPSENAAATAAAIGFVVARRLDPGAYAVVNGSADAASALLDAGDDARTRWGKIIYTGSHAVARVIARRAAETLTPCIFELGGPNPAIVTRHADIALAARRLMWAAALNAGQVCMKQNFILVEREVQERLVDAFGRALRDFFPQGARASPDYTRIVNLKNFHRIRDIVARSRGTVVVGGEMDETELYIEPTVVAVSSIDDPAVREESFGPVSALVPFDSLDEAIRLANQVNPTPLALCTFGSAAENEQVLDETISGGATINDSFMHGALSPAPFGGVGSSGTGSYRGRASFDAFTHRRTVASVPGWMDRLLRARYMPYVAAERKILRIAVGPAIDFDRDGRVVWGLRWWVSLLVRLAGMGIVVRWLSGLIAARVLGREWLVVRRES